MRRLSGLVLAGALVLLPASMSGNGFAEAAPGQAAQALGQSLQYVRGRPGNEIYLALRNLGGSGLVPYRHRLFLQFRHGRLAGWKEDYGENWMWE